MARTPRQRVDTANQGIDQELFDGSQEFIKRDNEALQKGLDRIKNKSLQSDSNEILSVITRMISDNYVNTDGNINSTRVVKDEDKNSAIKQLSDIFQDEDVNNDTRRYARYGDYRILDKYIAEVSEAIDVLRDSILSPDDMSKKSTLFHYDGSLNEDEESEFRHNMKTLFEGYNFEKFVSDKVRTTLVNGDGFTIVDSISNEFSKILNESEEIDGNWQDDGIQLNEDIFQSVVNKYEGDLKESFVSRIHENYLTEDIVNGQAFKNAQAKYIDKSTKDILKAVNDNVKFIKDPSKLLIDASKYGNTEFTDINSTRKKKIDINGVYFKSVQPEDIVKLEIDHICVGYLYINRINRSKRMGNIDNMNPSNSMLSALASVSNPDAGNMSSHQPIGQAGNKFDIDQAFSKDGNTALEYEVLIDMLIQGISKKIDNKFIEKNESVRDLLLALVKTDYIIDKEVEITFLEPEKVHHIKLNSMTTYGDSVIEPSLFYAKLYLSALITNMMVKINQGRDKRVFYVDTDMDSDLEGNIQQIIRDVRSNELPSDLFSEGQSVSTVMNSVGSLDNFYVPTINGKFICPVY